MREWEWVGKWMEELMIDWCLKEESRKRIGSLFPATSTTPFYSVLSHKGLKTRILWHLHLSKHLYLAIRVLTKFYYNRRSWPKRGMEEHFWTALKLWHLTTATPPSINELLKIQIYTRFEQPPHIKVMKCILKIFPHNCWDGVTGATGRPTADLRSSCGEYSKL